MSYYTTSVLRLGPAFSPARRAIVHSSHESHHALARFRGTLHRSIVSFSSRSRPCSHFSFHLVPPRSKPTSSSQSYSSHIVSFPRSTAPRYPTLTARVRACNTHTLSLSLFSPTSFVPSLSLLGSRPALDHLARTRLTLLMKPYITVVLNRCLICRAIIFVTGPILIPSLGWCYR